MNPDNDFVLERVRKLVASEKHIWVSVQLHAKDVPNGVVFSLYSESSGIDDLGIPLIRNLLDAFGDDESLVSVGSVHLSTFW